MSDFDDFFKDKLEEEQSFPRRSRNWKSVSKRLDAFDAGGHIGHSHLRYWKIATVAASIAVGILAWKVVDLRQELLEVRSAKSEVRSGGTEVRGGEDEVVSPVTEAEKATPGVQNRTPVKENTPYKSIEEKPGNRKKRQEIKSMKPEGAPAKRDVAGVQSQKSEVRSEKSEKSEVTSSESGIAPLPGAPATPATQKNPDLNAVAENDRKQDLLPPLENQYPSENTAAQVAAKNDSLSAVTQHSTPDSIRRAPAAQPVLQDPVAASLNSPVQDSTGLKKGTAENESDKPVLASKPEDQPRRVRTYDRLRAGAQVIGGYAVPGETGVSLLKGQGITAAWRFWKDFSLTGSADWLRFDLNTSKFVQRFHPHHPHPHHGGPGGPGGPMQEDQLVQVESTQRQRQLSLGLSYAVPVRFWVRPTVQVAHTWVNIAPQLLSLKFETPPQGGPGGPGGNPEPRYFAEKTETQRLDQIWRFGVGLQRETNRWTFTVGADYLKDLAASDAMFNSVLLKAGLQYKIL